MCALLSQANGASALKELSGIDLCDHCDILGLPSTLSYASNKEILRFLRDQRAKAGCWNRCRLMLVGESNVGKTYLRHRLVRPQCDLPPVAGEELASTDGVDVEHFLLPVVAAHAATAAPTASSSSVTSASEPMIRCSVWDFAGQTSYYASHHAFLASECVYLVCFNMREMQKNWSGAQLTQETKIAYWLHSIQSHAPGAQVVLVGTQADPSYNSKLPGGIVHNLSQRFPSLNFHGPVEVCARSKDDTRVENKLKALIRNVIETHLPNVQVAYPLAMLKLASMLEMPRMHSSAVDAGELVSAAAASAHSAASPSFPLAAGAPAASSSASSSSAASKISPSVTSLLHAGRALRLAEFDQVLRAAGLDPATHRSLCLSVFHAAGLLLHFDTDALRDFVFPDPRWVADQMALVVSERGDIQSMTDGGIISVETLGLLWRQHQKKPSLAAAAHPGAEMALISLLTQFRIGIRLDATSVLIPAKLPSEHPIDLVQTDAESGLLMPRPQVRQATAEPLQCTRLRFQFGRHLPKHFVEWEGLHSRLQVSLHPVGCIFGKIKSVFHPCAA
jgi:GTPase SAR1 family protein